MFLNTNLSLECLLSAVRFRGLRAATRAFRSPWTFGRMLLLDLQFLLEIGMKG